jgi:hypothetical protein
LQFVDADAKLTLQDSTNKGVIGFWISGFGQGRDSYRGRYSV